MRMIINGNDADAISGKTFSDVNPYSGEVICDVPAGNAEDFERAAIVARNAQPEWADMPLYERAEIIKRFVVMVRKEFDDIAGAICAESGKVIKEVRAELESLCDIFESYIEVARHIYGSAMPGGAKGNNESDIVFVEREPLGVFVVLVPTSFPADIFAHKVAPALVIGNAVIIRPSTETAKSARLLTEYLLKAGVPVGIAQCITGSEVQVREWLAETKNVDAVSYTGNKRSGSEFMRCGANNLQKVFLDISGNDPFVIFEDADMEAAANQAISVRKWNAGQVSCANKRFIVHKSVKNDFTKLLVEGLKKLKIGDPANADTDLGPLVSEQAADFAYNQIQYTISQGGKCIYGGDRSGAFISPTVIDGVTSDMDIAKDLEIFAPVFPIIEFNTFDEAVDIANSMSYGVVSRVMTGNIGNAMKFARKVKTETCIINGEKAHDSMYTVSTQDKSTEMGSKSFARALLDSTKERAIFINSLLMME